MRPQIISLLNDIDQALEAAWGNVKEHDPLVWRSRFAAIGITTLDLPLDYGGLGCSAREMIEFFALFGHYSLDLRDVPGIGHFGVMRYLRSGSTARAFNQCNPSDSFAAIAITEPTGGSDLKALKTVANPIDDGYTLTGSKKYISRVEQATHIIVFANVPRHGDMSSLSVFLLNLSTTGKCVVPLQSMGIRGVSWSEITFNDVFIPRDARLGGEGEGFRLFRAHFSYWRIMMAAAAIGCARGAIDLSIERLRTRSAFGGPIGRFTHLQLDLAQHVSQLHQAWLMIIDAAQRLDSGANAYFDAAMTKAETVEAALSAASWAMKVHGAEGYLGDVDLEKRYRDLLGLRIADGTTDVLRGQVARGLMGEDLYALSLSKDAVANSGEIISGRKYWKSRL